ncbi:MULTISPECIES: CGNR zinc finger domain-containing protein [unclassified Streptomyces]|uniref:CGNR zinc finger domain-containing protein n=1 Tax=unclassified Streptomyces TaxID=2593676 RepID=UPI002E11D1C1|nr:MULTISPECIES: CGNR zinc finger domain-containing protein [unclassified Streptomyces]WSR23556.1 CGNR zinc finger domain-containing protein [Streptomyces sp. NBC_01205]
MTQQSETELQARLEARGWPGRPLKDEPLAADLINTQWLAGTDAYDLLEEDALTLAWLDKHGLNTGAAAADVRTHLRETRTTLAATVADPTDTTALNRILDHGRIKLSLNAGETAETPEVADPAHHAAWMCARDLLRAMTQTPGRLRKCANPPCPLHFLDTSRKGERRWCSMAVCGNRAKAQRHRTRHDRTT